ncbi:hypothetical protein SC127_10885 [Pantoea sp. T14]|uniref:hypothetical protein n=1 Tax=Pantoea sp. T14 TaxID=3085685 RepID=UPI002FC9A480
MYIVKSCHSGFNPLNGRTIRIGSIDEYRQTEIEEIADEGEATFGFTVDLKNADIPMALFEALQSGAGMLNDTEITMWSGMRQSSVIKGGMHIGQMKSRHLWHGRNCLAFCMSRLNAHEEASTLFESYDDYWYFEESCLEQIGELIRQQVESKLRQDMLESGNPKSLSRLEKFTCQLKVQQVIYSTRHVEISNFNPEARSPGFLDKLFNNYRYLKPQQFSHEKEIRFLFECFDDGELIFPEFKSLIIDATPVVKFIKRK